MFNPIRAARRRFPSSLQATSTGRGCRGFELLSRLHETEAPHMSAPSLEIFSLASPNLIRGLDQDFGHKCVATKKDLLGGFVAERRLIIISTTPHDFQPVETTQRHQFLRKNAAHPDLLRPGQFAVTEIEKCESENLASGIVLRRRLDVKRSSGNVYK
jgi:hypothetical protein